MIVAQQWKLSVFCNEMEAFSKWFLHFENFFFRTVLLLDWEARMNLSNAWVFRLKNCIFCFFFQGSTRSSLLNIRQPKLNNYIFFFSKRWKIFVLFYLIKNILRSIIADEVKVTKKKVSFVSWPKPGSFFFW